MSRFILGNCIDVMRGFPDRAVDLIVTDPPYLVGFKDRSGADRLPGIKRTNGCNRPRWEMYRVLKKDALMVSFYGWNRVDCFLWPHGRRRVLCRGPACVHQTYASNRRNAKDRRGIRGHRHEGAYVLPKAARCRPSDRCRM